ncbi:MAG: TerB family tellurite resistance protein [Pontibacter sp.]|nr:TerB family tellurite resistance protein [Pontibacter sp.]
MKKIIVILLFIVGLSGTQQASAQADEAAQLLLNVEKLAQLKQILTDLEKGYRVVNTGYTTIRNISEGNFNIHKAFLDGLIQVSPAVRDYYKVAGIIEYQLALVKEYKNANRKFQQSGYFNPAELDYMGNVYSNLFQASLQNLDELAIIVTAGKLRMSDDERMEAIDGIYADMEDKLHFLRYFNNGSTELAIQRAKEKNDADRLRNLYGINE